MRRLQSHPFSRPNKVVPFVMQDKVWVDASLMEVRIKDMDADYLQAVMLMIHRKAPDLKLMAELSYITRGASPESIEEFKKVEPYSWIRQTPLFVKILGRYLKTMDEGIRVDRPITLQLEDQDDPGVHASDGLPY
jgi:hypothetical protein